MSRASVSIEWPTIERMDYLVMIDRHRPFWSALHEFVYANRIVSMVDVGCGAAEMCTAVDFYTGIDTNAKVLRENELFYRKGNWIKDDWLEMDVDGLGADLFLSASLIEHCESFEPFLLKMMTIPLKYAVVTFHKGLRGVSHIGQKYEFFDNLYCIDDVMRWLADNVNGYWHIFTLPLSRSPRMCKNRWDSVLVIDGTRTANLDMWKKRNVAR